VSDPIDSKQVSLTNLVTTSLSDAVKHVQHDINSKWAGRGRDDRDGRWGVEKGLRLEFNPACCS